MIDLLDESQRLLREAGGATNRIALNQRSALAFETATVIGFVIFYEDPSSLLEQWSNDEKTLVMAHQLGLRRAQTKAWNTYTVFIARADATYGERAALSSVEEDLTGTRKIARAGIRDSERLRNALLPMLPIQNAPQLEAVDMMTEIKLRTTELPMRVIDAFLSGEREASVALILEEEP
jgi:hypothetical protein